MRPKFVPAPVRAEYVVVNVTVSPALAGSRVIRFCALACVGKRLIINTNAKTNDKNL